MGQRNSRHALRKRNTMSYCKHNRKAWKCRLCSSNEARAYGTALEPGKKDDMIEMSVNMGAPNTRKTFAQAMGRTKRMTRERYAREMTNDFNGPPTRNLLSNCPVPQELYHSQANGMDLISWERLGREYHLIFGHGTHQFNQLILIEKVEQFKHAHHYSETKVCRDSDFIIHMMECITDKKFTLNSATSLIERFLQRKHGPRCKLNGPPRVNEARRSLTFPTCYGLKTVSFREFDQWLRQYKHPGVSEPFIIVNNNQTEDIMDEMLKELTGKTLESLIVPKALLNTITSSEPPVDSLTVSKNCVLNIEHNCTINIAGNTYNVRKEGDRFILLDKNLKPVRSM